MRPSLSTPLPRLCSADASLEKPSPRDSSPTCSCYHFHIDEEECGEPACHEGQQMAESRHRRTAAFCPIAVQSGRRFMPRHLHHGHACRCAHRHTDITRHPRRHVRASPVRLAPAHLVHALDVTASSPCQFANRHRVLPQQGSYKSPAAFGQPAKERSRTLEVQHLAPVSVGLCRVASPPQGRTPVGRQDDGERASCRHNVVLASMRQKSPNDNSALPDGRLLLVRCDLPPCH